jgi:acetyl-CoA carboxylase biotin carboxyl carrier protein
VNIEELRKLAALLREEELTELTVEEEGKRVTLRRSPRPPVAPPTKEGEIVRSPVVGTFWRRPSPAEPPFVEVGSQVKPGQILCIIEAMKVMNEVRAERAGVVEEILIEDGRPVEYGQPLFRLRPG